MPCCPHDAQDHKIVAECREVIHYPSEDYPCVCPGWEQCNCQHPEGSHVKARVCTICSCRDVIG